MTRPSWITAILSIVWLFTGCYPPNSPADTPIAQDTRHHVPIPDTKEEELTTMEQQRPYLIGAYYYPWYSPDRHWDSGYRGTPVLGEYDSANLDVINQHLTWAEDYGIDFFALSWWGKGSFEDDVIRGPWLDALQGHDFHFAILYESVGQLKLQNGQINLDNAAIRQQLIADFTYLADTFFQHPNVLTIEGRPVIFLYLTRTFAGDVNTALTEAKGAAVNRGSAEPFIVGDEVYWQYPDRQRILYFDAVTSYNMHTSVPNIADGFAENVERQYRLWADITAEQGIPFIPDILPGFNDTAVRPEAHHPVIPRSVDLFTAQFDSARELASGEPGIIMITSWNEWHEDTSIEPTEEEGTTYLEILRNMLTP
jgi:hypothetical protein